MRAALCAEHGPPESLHIAEVDDPVAGPGDVLVDIELAAVNYPDVLVIANEYQVSVPEQALRALRFKGRFVTVGFASGEIPRIPLNLVLLKGCIVRGFEMRTFGQNEPALSARGDAELLELLASGPVAPHVSAVHPLDDAASALHDVAGRTSTGKVLLHCRPPA